MSFPNNARKSVNKMLMGAITGDPPEQSLFYNAGQIPAC
jgi:hypothetical protein